MGVRLKNVWKRPRINQRIRPNFFSFQTLLLCDLNQGSIIIVIWGLQGSFLCTPNMNYMSFYQQNWNMAQGTKMYWVHIAG